ncbi:hypothetical protein E4U13_008286 [Claviceps humidiphila]|uniref:C3H1-type domain-containing protein n=1 Tax=Claviceps humidiphila TaxID=1294629 RepID=A0A9P7Q4U1_9HYPO|nr:hypothetical protein E4U13_008286 [Claviceps humidiphila]
MCSARILPQDGMPLTSKLMEFIQRLENIRQYRDSYDQLTHDLLLHCRTLETSFQRLETRHRDELQDCKSENLKLIAQLSNSEATSDWYTREIFGIRNKNAYVLVVIDGDGLLFRDQWIEQGLEGGRRAALALEDAVRARCGEHGDGVEVVVKVVANVDGLAKILDRDVSDIRGFALGFTQAKASFDFIIVGPENGCTTAKVRETVKWHGRNYNCKHVLMGISHDPSYTSFLDGIALEEDQRERLTVLEGLSAQTADVPSNIKRASLGNELFRTDGHTDRDAPIWPLGAWATVPRACNTARSVTSMSTRRSYANVANSTLRSPPPLPPSPKTSLPVPPKPIARPVQARYQQVPPQRPDWNPGPRGLDEPIAVSVSVMESVKRRRDSEKLCNNHFLRGPCTKGARCYFVHNYSPSKEEIDAITVLARQNPCVTGQRCKAKACIYGHHCPSVRDGVCTHPFCKFTAEAHPPGTKFKSPNIRAT